MHASLLVGKGYRNSSHHDFFIGSRCNVFMKAVTVWFLAVTTVV